MYKEYQKIKDSTPSGGIPKWMKDFDKKYNTLLLRDTFIDRAYASLK